MCASHGPALLKQLGLASHTLVEAYRYRKPRYLRISDILPGLFLDDHPIPCWCPQLWCPQVKLQQAGSSRAPYPPSGLPHC